MKLEELIGRNIASHREWRELSQAQLGDALATYLGKAWSRQAVSSAEKGRRAFTAAELVALSLALRTSVPGLLLPADELPAGVELPGGPAVPFKTYEEVLFFEGDVTRTSATRVMSEHRVRRLAETYSELERWHNQLKREVVSGRLLVERAQQALSSDDPVERADG